MKNVCSLLAILLAASSAAHAAPKSKKSKASPDAALSQEAVQEVTIPMARGELEAEVAAEQAQRERANAPKTRLEIGLSSWKPSRVVTPSRIANASEFRTKGIPSADVSLFTPVVGRKLYVQFGANFLAMERTGSIESTGISVPAQQNGYVTSLRVGAQLMPWLLAQDRLVPYAAAAALPSLVVTRPGPFDDGANDTGVPFEFGAGALYRVYKSADIDLGVTQTLGRVQDSDFKGFAVRAGVRVSI